MNPAGVSAVVITLNPWTAAPTPPGLPTIEVNGVLNPFSTTNGTASAAQVFTASGSDLLGSILVTAPTGFELSTTGVGSFSANLTLDPTSGSVPLTSIYARIGATQALGTFSGNISLTSANATTQNIAVTGNVTAANSPYQNWVAYWTNLNPSFSANSSGTADPDGDGYVNDTEFAFDGNPTVPNASLLTANYSGGNMTITFLARTSNSTVWTNGAAQGACADYQVQGTTNLTTGFSSANVSVSLAPDQNGIQAADVPYNRWQFVVPVTGTKNFYRVLGYVGTCDAETQ